MRADLPVAELEGMSRDELIVLVRRQAGRITVQDQQILMRGVGHLIAPEVATDSETLRCPRNSVLAVQPSDWRLT